MDRALSDDDVPTVPAFPVPGLPDERAPKELVIDTAAESFFALALATDDIAQPPTDEELAAWWSAQRRRSLSRCVVAVVVACLAILAASAARLA